MNNIEYDEHVEDEIRHWLKWHKISATEDQIKDLVNGICNTMIISDE